MRGPGPFMLAQGSFRGVALADSTGAAAGGNGDGGGADADGGGTGIPAAPAVGPVRRWLGAVHRSILWAHRRVHRAARYGLIVYGGILGGVGFLDIYRGLNLEVRTDGALLLLAGVAAIGGCTVALRRGADIPPHRWWVIGADGAAFAVSAWLVYRVQSNFVLQLVLQPWLFISAVVVVLAGLFSALVLYGDVSERRDPPSSAAAQEERPARATLLAGALGALGTLLAAALTLPQFWYSSHYEPSNAPPVVAVENSIDDVETRGDHVEFSVSITVENKAGHPSGCSPPCTRSAGPASRSARGRDSAGPSLRKDHRRELRCARAAERVCRLRRTGAHPGRPGR